MTARLTFLAIAAFWLTMNGLLWRSEYGSQSGEIPVPAQIIWRKILTAPDASSLSVYQNGERMGYCEFTTRVGQEMSTFEGNAAPPAGLVKRAGYQVHLAGNVALGDFTNRLKFEGRIQFNKVREWKEINLRISSRLVLVEIHSIASNRMVHVKISSDGSTLERDLTFDQLQKPNVLINAFTGGFGDSLLDVLDLPDLSVLGSGPNVEWSACRTRVKIRSESVPIYRLKTSVLGRNITLDIGTLGEILRVELPGNVSAQIDEWNR